jgi:hypothetical protein
MRRKVFWISFVMLGLIADVMLPLVWGIAATLPLLVMCWWFAYRTDLFDD